MDETRIRAVIREEIALAMGTLGRVAGSNAGAMSEDRAGERDGGYAIESAAGVYFTSAYEADCAVADEQRAADAENPFTEAATDAAVDPSVKAFVHDEVQNVLKEIRDQFYLSGRQDDLNIGNRLDHLISQRERYADE